MTGLTEPGSAPRHRARGTRLRPRPLPSDPGQGWKVIEERPPRPRDTPTEPGLVGSGPAPIVVPGIDTPEPGEQAAVRSELIEANSTLVFEIELLGIKE